ncbi:hypothetical protein KUU02_29910, partial [Pseudomonas aeruginosa]|nr:hypothetical protein [Pseudomonas aeruginosa]MBV6215883.1 hypothetical protein [Pseudomonas aeruginosa]MCS8321385.1 hypothetical protein [Pseudomonas aeruginosa]
MNAKRKATLLGALAMTAFYILLIFAPAWGGLITAEQPATAPVPRTRQTRSLMAPQPLARSIQR